MDDRRSITPDVIGTDTDSNSHDDTVSDDADADRTVHIDSVDQPWTTYFPFDEPYTDQVDGINSFLDALTDNGYMVMEGACGTGKTLIGLVGGIYATRATRQYDRVLIATPVKQQLKQFIEEMRTINAQLDGKPPVGTVVARGKQDMSPYVNIDSGPFRENTQSFHDTLQDMREATVGLIDFDSDVPLDWPADLDHPIYSEYDGDWDDAGSDEDIRDSFRYDPYRARAVMETWSDVSGERFSVDGYESPYPDQIPVYGDVARRDAVDADSALGLKLETAYFDPFYAGFFAFKTMPFGFDDAVQNVMDGDTLRELSITNGILPHEALATFMQSATVVVGNYNHVFDTEQTRLLTDDKADILDEKTITILDEAHNLESVVRDMLSTTAGQPRLRWAKADLETILGYVNKDVTQLPATEPRDEFVIDTNHNSITTRLDEHDITVQDIGRAITFINDIESFLFDRAQTYLDNEFTAGASGVARMHSENLSENHVPLEDPDTANVDDELVTTVTDADMMDWIEFRRISARINTILSSLDSVEREPSVGDLGRFLLNWYEADGYDYFREIVLEPSASDHQLNTDYGWSENYIPSLSLYNTIPTTHIRSVLSELGGGLLMSATLEPLDGFIETTGVGRCIHPDSVADKDERRAYVLSGQDDDPDVAFRDVTTVQFPLRFPQDNRDSFAVTAPKYTATNRGDRTTNREHMTRTRQTYADVVTDIASSYGNVLIAFPSYSEASWAHDVLTDRISKPVLVDESTTADKTDALLDRFGGDDHAVVLTSSRGTITEGVDYNGDLLHTAAVVGISLTPPTARHQAVENAYDELLPNIGGWEAADLIPATRKARQAIGRVIRGSDERGVRILVDERYTHTGWGGVKDYLSDQEQDEFTPVAPPNVSNRLQAFWDTHLD